MLAQAPNYWCDWKSKDFERNANLSSVIQEL
jgi:hypothetical protein